MVLEPHDYNISVVLNCFGVKSPILLLHYIKPYHKL